MNIITINLRYYIVYFVFIINRMRDKLNLKFIYQKINFPFSIIIFILAMKSIIYEFEKYLKKKLK